MSDGGWFIRRTSHLALVEDFATDTGDAVDAEFDGVEIQGANSFRD